MPEYISFPVIGGDRVAVTLPDKAATLAEAEARLRDGRGFALATINLDHLTKLRRDRAFAEAYLAQDMVVADGNPIVWLSALAGKPTGLVPGSELVDPLAAICARIGAPLAMLGTTEAALAAAEAELVRRHPGLRVAAAISPPMGFDPASAAADECIDRIEASGARLCLLALGAPKQEILAARARGRAPGIGFVSVGAGVDFVAGTQKRAPVWARRAKMEWAWRMLSDPRRLFKRYAECFAILPGLALQAWKDRAHG
ncbi:MAG: glycosyltransferase [Rhodobacteraceae bacterium]|nr:glycosyltransferase [Paracoccaceae bacterium]MBR28602.1 glycosyltransferase [Paracoccaceae bacterium]